MEHAHLHPKAIHLNIDFSSLSPPAFRPDIWQAYPPYTTTSPARNRRMLA